MSFISSADAEQLKEIFAKELRDEVTILLFLKNEESTSREARELMEEVRNLSSKIKLQVHDFEKDAEAREKYGIARAPALTLLGKRDYRIRYYGVPIEQEFETLIEWLLGVSRGEAELEESTKMALAQLGEERKLTLLVTYACSRCPRVAQLAISFALASEKISLDIIDVYEFPEAKQEFPFISTPKIFAGDKTLTGPRGGDEAALLELIK